MDISIILALVFGIPTIIGISYQVWQTKLQNEALLKKNEILKNELVKLKAEKVEEYPSRDLSKIVELLRKSTKQISILGLVGWQPIHEAHSIIVDMINNHNVKIRIIIANPESKYFKNRAIRENDKVGRLLQEHNSTITELKDILSKIKPDKKEKLIIKIYNNLQGDISIQMVDDEEMYVNERIAGDGIRTYESPMYKVRRDKLAQRITFQYFKEIFENVWNDEKTKEIKFNKNQ